MPFHNCNNPRLPEVFAMIMLEIATNQEGITIDDMSNIYESVVGKYPSHRTITRILSRLNMAVDPCAGDDCPRAIITIKNRPGRYIYVRPDDSYLHLRMAGG